MKNLFKEAHEMTREIVKEYGVDYKTQFALCASYLAKNKGGVEMEFLAIKNKEGGFQTIEEHGQHALDAYESISEVYNLDQALVEIIKVCPTADWAARPENFYKEEHVEYVLGLIRRFVANHDQGKRIEGFQKKIRGEKHYSDSTHSDFSAWLFINEELNSIETLDLSKLESQGAKTRNIRFYKRVLRELVICFGFVMSRHHSEDCVKDFENIDDGLFYNRLVKNYGELPMTPDDVQDARSTFFKPNMTLLCKLIHSLLVASDTIAKNEFENNVKIDVRNAKGDVFKRIEVTIANLSEKLVDATKEVKKS